MKFPHKFAFLLATAALCTLPIAAQQPDTPQPQQPQPQQPQPQQPQPDTQPAPAQQPQQQDQAAPPPAAAQAAAPLSPISTELTGKIDSKTAKAGDSVVLKTTSNATMPDGTVIPKGSKIVGHVTEAQAHSGDSANGRVTLQFDQAQLKTGQSLPILSALQSVAPAGGSADSGGGAAPMSGGSAPSTAGSGSGTSGGSGAASGGGSGSTASRPTQSAPSPGMASSGGDAQGGAPAPGTTVAQNGNVVIRTTSVPGVLVACSANGRPFSNASGALMSAQQDVHLDGGTKVMLEIASSSGPGNSR
jgi:hypothetical protein